MNAGRSADTCETAAYPDALLLRREIALKDVFVGRVISHPGKCTITDADDVLFAAVTSGSTPSVSGSGQLGIGHREWRRRQIASMHVFGVVYALSRQDLAEVEESSTIEKIAFPRSVRVGDTITAHSRVVDMCQAEASEQSGAVTWETIGVSQEGAEVIRYTRSFRLAKLVAADGVNFQGFAEDFVPGMRFRHWQSKTIGDVDLGLAPVVMGGAQVRAAGPRPAGQAGADQAMPDDLLFALVVGLTLEETAAHLVREVSMADMRVAHHVVGGDVLSACTEVLDVKGFDAHSDDVTFRHFGLNQDDTLVVQMDRTARLRRRRPHRTGVPEEVNGGMFDLSSHWRF